MTTIVERYPSPFQTRSHEPAELSTMPLQEIVRHRIHQLLAMGVHSVEEEPSIYAWLMNEVEKGMIEAALAYTDDNESRACRLLGISRGTLRQRRHRWHTQRH